MQDSAFVAQFIAGGVFWVHLAALFYVAGFAARDQIVLRVLLLCGTICYTLYYFIVGDAPQWSALFWSVFMGTVNVVMLIRLILERTTFSLSADEKQLYGAFGAMSPGEFRRVLKLAQWKTQTDAERMTTQGKANGRLYYLFDGHADVVKDDKRFVIGPDTFVGEMSYILGSDASATVHSQAGTRVVSWDHGALRELERQQPNLRVALREALSFDLARKLTESVIN